VGGGIVGPIINWALAGAALLGLAAAGSAALPFHLIFYVPALMA
jgi:hypothetical protein